MNASNQNDSYLMYNKSYEKFTPDYVEENLLEIKKFALENIETLKVFFENYCQQFHYPHKSKEDTQVLDLGCGIGGLSLYLAKRGFDVSSLDISSLALSILETLLTHEGLNFKTICSDVTEKNLNLNNKYDVIIDSHLLHCLTDPRARKRYFEFIQKHLSAGGIFLLESMAYQAKIQIPVGYRFDEDYILWQQFKEKELPIRKILPSLELENEVFTHDLKIHYLYYHSELSFQVFPDYPNYPLQYLPKTIRLAASLN